jgi:hypothetical protein
MADVDERAVSGSGTNDVMDQSLPGRILARVRIRR